MKLMRRFIAMAVILLLLLAIKLNNATDEYAVVDEFRGGVIEESVLYPLIAKSVNDSGGLIVTVDGTRVGGEAAELYLSDEMEIMSSLEFIRNIFYTSAECYDGRRIVLERNNKLYEFKVGRFAGTAGGENVRLNATPVTHDGKYYMPLKDLCDLFGYTYEWDMENTWLALTSTEDSEVRLAKSFDLRERDRISTIRDQGDTHTCWAYAALGAIESSLLPEESLPLSADHMIDNKPYSYAYNDGGDFAMALSYLLSWKGPVSEEDGSVVKHVQEAHFYDTDDIDEIKWGVFLYGGVSTSIYANIGSVSLGGTSYYNSETNAYCYRGQEDPNHDVIIIGWNDDYPAKNFYGEVPGNGAFICQNSWGADFGEDGVFYVSYYDSNIGHQAVSYAKLENATNYDHIYQSDLAGWTGQIGYNKSDAWVASVYRAGSAETLKSVGFYALGKNTRYQIYVVRDYLNVGSLAKRTSVASGMIRDEGFYTVPILEDTEVSAGEQFAVILYVNTPSEKHPVAIEFESSNMVPGSVDITDGESYSSRNGLDWESVEETSDGNVCLKVYTRDRETTETLSK